MECIHTLDLRVQLNCSRNISSKSLVMKIKPFDTGVVVPRPRCLRGNNSSSSTIIALKPAKGAGMLTNLPNYALLPSTT